MTIDDIKLYLMKSPDLLEDIFAIMKYRDLRHAQVFYAKLLYEYRNYANLIRVSKTVESAGELDRSAWELEALRLDKERRNKHNLALLSFSNMIDLGRKNNLPELYEGEVLTRNEIFSHADPYGMTRQRMTDAMFAMLNAIERGVIKDEMELLTQVQGTMEKSNDQFHIQRPMLHDESTRLDGGVVFDRDLATIFDNFFTE